MVNNSISLSIKFNQLPDDTCRLLATWIISHLDKNGVFYGDSNTVKSLVLPFRSDITIERVETYLQAMERIGLITRFEENGLLWQWWPTFADNQVGLRPEREATSFPFPPAAPAGTSPANYPPPVDTPPKNSTPPAPIPLPVDNEGDNCRNDAGNVPENIPHKVKVKFKEESKDKVHGGDTKSSRVPAKARASPSPPPFIPAFKVWVDSGLSRGIDKDFISELDRVVGRDPPSLTLFSQICVAGRRKGWRKNNIDWAIDWFKRGEVPGQNKNDKNGGYDATNRNGNHTPTAAAIGLGQWTAGELREVGLSEPEIERMLSEQLVGG